MRTAPATAYGFSLIELLITMVALAIITAIAVPAYQDSVRKSRRAEAVAALMAVQQAQERWRSNHAEYSTEPSDLNIATETSSGYYDISIAAAPGDAPLSTAYVATAVGKDGTSQAGDTQCRKLSLQVDGGNIGYAGCGSCSTFTYTPTQACWAH
jgi:type IV pilus assembly protein PilE